MTHMPDKLKMGFFYAPAPMSEYFFSVINSETKMEPKASATYIRSDLVRGALEKLMFDLKKDPYLSKNIMANFGMEIQDLLNRFSEK